MSRERILQIGVIASLLIAGLLIGWYFNAIPGAQPESPPTAIDSNIFRVWFWEHRNLDLLVQVMLIFVGALGVAAVLPKHAESPPTISLYEGSGTSVRVEKDGG
ncbi:MAG: hypothetical protein JXR84_11015 [Anaerolineae bacterium]|nr:hypothetical protein [Anaerolineae bacterium]